MNKVFFDLEWNTGFLDGNSFVKGNDFTGKTVIPFCTSATSDIGDSGKLLAQMAGTGEWLDGKRFAASASRESVENWVKQLSRD